MSFTEHWASLAVRIRGLREAGGLATKMYNGTSGPAEHLWRECGLVIGSLEDFRKAYIGLLPIGAQAGLDRLISNDLAQLSKSPSPYPLVQQIPTAINLIVALSVLESELTFILAGRQEQIRVRSERAFLLLSRQLVVDTELRKKWRPAFDDEHEPASERLGSIHMLSQGIYAFKINADGARTDLIFDEPPDLAVSRSAEGLVLTEWKKAGSGNWPTQYNIALVQADTYRRGALAGIELRDYCYLVAVSLKQLSQRDDIVSGGVRFRHINIVVDPDTPSIAARKLIKDS